VKQFKSLSIVFVLVTLAGTVLAEPPASSGIVSRDSYNGGYFDVDTNSGLLSIIGFDVVQWCNEEDDFSFDTFFYADKDLQDGFRLNTSENAYVQASVWPFTDFNCELFLTIDPLATGMANYRMHDNDLFGLRYCEEKNNMNAFGRRANGTLYSPSGEAKRFSMHNWGLFDCDTESFPVFETKISLTR
jgi:hypothetical protein